MQSNLPKKLFSAVLFAALSVSSSSYATCRQEDMAGVWQFFFDDSSLTVTLSISNTGEITQGSYERLDGYHSGELSGGNIEVRNNCRVYGAFYDYEAPDFFGPVEFKILDSRTRPDTEYWVGTFNYSFKQGALAEREFRSGSFGAVRILPN